MQQSNQKRPLPHTSTLVLLTGSGVMVLNIFMAALPDMARSFDVDYATIQLAITAYLMGTALAQIIIGPLSDRFGRRPVIMSVFAIFTLATIGAALAQSFEIFMIFRMIQCVAVGGGVISRAAVRDMVSGADAASMIAYVSMGMSLVPMLAPAVGGVIDELWGWRAVFYFMAFMGVICLIIAYFKFGETKHNRINSMRAQFALYPDLFRSKRFWGYTLILTLSSGMFFSYLTGGPFLGDRIYHLSGGELGFYLGSAPFGYFFGNWFSGRYADRLGVKRLIMLGLWVAFFGMSLALIPALFGSTNPIAFFGFTIFIGLGNGMVMPSANAGMLEARPDLAGSASGLSGAILMLGGAIMAQIGGKLLTHFPSPICLILLIIFAGFLAILAAIWTFRVEAQAHKDASAATPATH